MMDIRPRWFILFGAVCLILSVVFSILMVMRIWEASFPLVFLTYGLSFAGLMVGIIGVAFASIRR